MMNKKEILKKVGGILSELNEQFEYLSKSPDNLNELELELLSANANFLSDHLSILVKLNDTKVESKNNTGEQPRPVRYQSAIESSYESPEKPDEENLSEEMLGLEEEAKPGLVIEFEEKHTDKLFDQPLTDDEKRVIDENTILKSSVEEEADDILEFEEAKENNIDKVNVEILEVEDDEVYLKEVVISERTIAVPVETKAEDSPAPTVNDLLSKNVTQQTIAGQFNLRQAKDLKAMISLNDKLLFVRDLFNGYSLAYSEALELLNRFDSLEAADNFLKQNYAAKNNWADKKDVTDKFYEILNIRFAK